MVKKLTRVRQCKKWLPVPCIQAIGETIHHSSVTNNKWVIFVTKTIHPCLSTKPNYYTLYNGCIHSLAQLEHSKVIFLVLHILSFLISLKVLYKTFSLLLTSRVNNRRERVSYCHMLHQKLVHMLEVPRLKTIQIVWASKCLLLHWTVPLTGLKNGNRIDFAAHFWCSIWQ